MVDHKCDHRPSDPPSIYIRVIIPSSKGDNSTTRDRRVCKDSGCASNSVRDFSAHIKALKAKADKFAGYLKSPRLTPGDIRVFHRTIYDPAMRYSLPAVAVDEEELAQVQTKIIPTIVQKLGLSSKLPVAVRHGPISMGGLGLMDLRTEGGIEMIKYFRHEVYGNTEVGKLLLLQLQASQLESGVPMQLLAEPSTYTVSHADLDPFNASVHVQSQH
ncbi:hypothetical protein MHU86_18464 [Fragilaria crotonensis]|nr:hypothetical protein MHU86_18464 [Fragilaria crotonensis]